VLSWYHLTVRLRASFRYGRGYLQYPDPLTGVDRRTLQNLGPQLWSHVPHRTPTGSHLTRLALRARGGYSRSVIAGAIVVAAPHGVKPGPFRHLVISHAVIKETITLLSCRHEMCYTFLLA
jgi:hypothetical protein